MKCAQCQELIHQRLDGLEPSDSAALEPHLRECPACRALITATNRLCGGLRLLSPPSPPRELNARITACLQAESTARLHRRRRLGIALALAASVLVIVSAWLLRPGAPVVSDNSSSHLNHQANQRPSPPSEDALDLRESVSEVGSAMVSAATRTTDAALAQSLALLPRVPSAPIPTLNVPVPTEPARSLQEAGQGLSEGLAPVTDSARRAFDLFLRDLSPMEFEGKPGF